MKNILLLVLVLISITATAQRNKLKNITEKDGKIGIGTNIPDELLTVKGKIHTQEVLVDLNGAVAPDYVFEKYYEGTSNLNTTYDFPNLSEIELYIKEHHHLPGVPSAEELNENGLSLKKMTLILLEKLEELTLYTIQQQKEIDLLKESLKEMDR